MKININIIVGKENVDLEVKKGVSILKIIEEFPRKLEEIKKEEGPFLIAEIEGEYKSLATTIEKETTIKLLGVKSQAANISYQNTLIVMYLYSVERAMQAVNVKIENTLSGGVFSLIEGLDQVDYELCEKIKAEMNTLVKRNLKIRQYEVWGEEGETLLKKEGVDYSKDFFAKATKENPFRYCEFDGFKKVVYSVLMPNTGMVDKWDVNSYKEGLVLRGPDDRHGFAMADFEEEENLYKAFKQEKEWGEMLKINNIEELNEAVKNGDIKEKMLLAESFHQQKIVEITKEIVDKGSRIIFLSGPSSSGKTTTSKRLILQLKVNGYETVYIGTDDYFVERHEQPKDEYGEYDFDRGLENMDVSLFVENMKDLLSGKEVDIPVYDFVEGKKVFGTRKSRLKEGELIIVEGIHALNKEISKDIDESDKYKIYISPLTQINIDEHNRVSTRDNRLIRRMIRDHSHRDYSPQDTLKTWPKVRDGEERNVFPGNKEADVVFNSSLIYELGVLRKYIEPLLAEVGRDEEAYAEANRILGFIRKIEVIEDENYIFKVSLLREFIGGGVF